ncbi:MAG: hypothetical protein ACK583_10655, partial [Cyanobacteriota bacterium]
PWRRPSGAKRRSRRRCVGGCIGTTGCGSCIASGIGATRRRGIATGVRPGVATRLSSSVIAAIGRAITVIAIAITLVIVSLNRFRHSRQADGV